MLEDQPIDCFIGNNVIRVEDDKLLNGKGQFGSDTPFKPDALHAVVLRSEYASAKIKKIAPALDFWLDFCSHFGAFGHSIRALSLFFA